MAPQPRFRCICGCDDILALQTIRLHVRNLRPSATHDNGNVGGIVGGDVGSFGGVEPDDNNRPHMQAPLETDIYEQNPTGDPPPSHPPANAAQPTEVQHAPAVEGGGNVAAGCSADFNMDVDDMDDTLDPPQVNRRVHRNPPVMIEDWPEPYWEPEFESDESDADEGPIPIDERDPEYIENTDIPHCDPVDEPELEDEELRSLLEAELGELDDTEWIDMYQRILSTRDHHTLRLLATRLRTHFSRSTYDDLRYGVCESLNLPSEFVAWRRLRILAQLETRSYDCCVNSCCCFLGKYKDDVTCPYCGESRFGPGGKRRRAFRYSPLIPQLRSLFQSPTMASKIRYRAEVEHEDQMANNTQANGDDEQNGEDGPVNDNDQAGDRYIQDVFDGEHYRLLRETKVDPNKEYCFFDNPEDIALGLSTDGFTLFKRRRRGLSAAWPIILVNYNLHPRIRTRLENIICIGVIPGPTQPKDLNSFLIPLLEELLDLEEGVEISGLRPDGTGYDFVLHAFIIIIFGDIPAVAKLLMMKGQNAFSPCRTCYIEGVLCKLAKSSVYYVPLLAPRRERVWECHDLPMRSHDYLMAHYDELDEAETQDGRDKIAKRWGVNGAPIFAHLMSIDLSTIAPYDIMHLLFENLVPNLIKLWTGKFKGLNQGTGSYQLSKEQWNAIGRLTAGAARTVPSAFVGTLPDIAQDGGLYKAEAHSFWIQFVAPVVLKGRLPEKYYKHFQLLREIIMRCLQLKITTTEVDELEHMVREWVTKYEEYYYQYKQSRLPACPLTIHALLHMPFYIRKTGPLWASWAFVMERFCGHMLPAVKNRTRPYDHLDNYIQRRAQMQIVSAVYNLPSLAKPFVRSRIVEGVEVSSHEVVYPEFPMIVLGRPQTKLNPDRSLLAKFSQYFGVAHNINQAALIRGRIDTDSVIRYGRFRMAGDGDRIRTSKQVPKDGSARDNSFVRYILFPDANAAFRNRPDVPVRQTQYGQLLDIYHVVFAEDDGTRARHILAHIQPCDTRGQDASVPFAPPVKYSRMLSTHIVHIDTIEAVIGRIKIESGWAIIDPSREAMPTQFINADGEELE